MGGGVSQREDECVARRNEGISLRGGRRKRRRRRGEAERVSVTFCGNDGHRWVTTTGGIDSLLSVHVAVGLSMGIGRVAVGFRDGLGQNNYTEGEGKREEYPKVSCRGRQAWRATGNRGTGRGGVCR